MFNAHSTENLQAKLNLLKSEGNQKTIIELEQIQQTRKSLRKRQLFTIADVLEVLTLPSVPEPYRPPTPSTLSALARSVKGMTPNEYTVKSSGWHTPSQFVTQA